MEGSQAQPDRAETVAYRPVFLAAAAAIVSIAVWSLTGSALPASAALVVTLVIGGLLRDRAALRADLEHVRQDHVALQKALQESQKMEAVGRLTAGIAHDFNNHLTVIASNVEMSKRRLEGNQERPIRHLDAALAGVQRAAVLTGRLLSFAHQPKSEPEPLDVARLLHGLSDLLKRTLGQGVDLAVTVPDERWCVWADLHQMENALLSLAINARDRVSHGGVLRLSASNVRLNEAFVAAHPGVLPGDYIRIAVSDSSLAPETDALVDWRAADDLANAGLSMARGVVRSAGGCLLLSGAVPGPPSLRLFLPRYLPPSPAFAAPQRRKEGQPTILVVEDDEAVRRACVETLRDLDYRVLEAPDAMEAFRLIADTGGIDLLFTDLGLPNGVSGRALADAARNVDPEIRVLFSSGYVQGDSQARSDTALLPKPFDPAQLAMTVRQVLSVTAAVGRTETVQG